MAGIGKSIHTKKRVDKATKERNVKEAKQYGRKTSVKTTNSKGKAYSQKAVKSADAKKDAKRSALAPGKRTTVWNTEYYETRVNRSDKPRKR